MVTIIYLFIYHILVHAHPILDELLNLADIHNHNIRRRYELVISNHRLALPGNSFSVRALLTLFNKLSPSSHPTPLNKFKQVMLKLVIFNSILFLK